MHQQFYYRLLPRKHQATIHPLIAIDHQKPPSYPLSNSVAVRTQDDLDAWVAQLLQSSHLEPTTVAHLEIAHTQPGDRVLEGGAAQWMLYAEACMRQQRHRTLIGDRPEQLHEWNSWLGKQPLCVQEFPASVHDYFSGFTLGSDAIQLMNQGPGQEWVTALMLCLNPSCKVDPAGRSHGSGALQPRVMANKGYYGWTLSYSVAHLDYSQVYVPVADDDEDLTDLGLNGKEATASKMTSMSQKDETGVWKNHPSHTTESASAWFDRLLLSMRHNKDVDRSVLEGIVGMAVTAGIPQTQIIQNELPKTIRQGCGLSKDILEVVTGQTWERIDQQITVLEGLGYKEELALYLWLHCRKEAAAVESYDLPALA